MIKEALFLFSKINSFGVHGVEGFPVTVEADVSDGLPGFITVSYTHLDVYKRQPMWSIRLQSSGTCPAWTT